MSLSEPPIAFLLGLPFHQTTMEETLATSKALIDRGEPSYIVTANADFVAQAYDDPDLRRILFFADRVVCDGMPLVWLSRLFRIPLPERIAGSDMVFHLFELCAQHGKSVFFLGSDDATLSQVAEILPERYPGLKIAGHIAPPIAPVHDWPNEAIFRQLHASKPDLLLVAVGCPKQERWIYQNFREAGVPLSVGIGASLDFISGKQVRSPKWMQKTGLEWVWRMGTDPGRLVKRYWKDFKYLVLLSLKQARIVSRKGKAPAGSARPSATEKVALSEKANISELHWSGQLQRNTLEQFPIPTAPDKPLLCRVADIPFIDSAGIGHLIALARACESAAVPCAFAAPEGHPLAQLVPSLRLESVLKVFPSETEAAEWLEARWQQQSGGQKSSTDIPSLVGELDAHTIGPVEATLQAYMDTVAEGTVLRVPASELKFVDSYAVGRLLALKKQALRQQKDLYLAEPSPEVLNILKLLHLTQLLIEAP
jgi:N-acetylglucosaminyldiphosphoundecaprenol N-acetyl-beta-D-mannosaminyltransferase